MRRAPMLKRIVMLKNTLTNCKSLQHPLAQHSESGACTYLNAAESKGKTRCAPCC